MYPTSRQIMAKEVKFKAETIAAVKAWKTENFVGWKNKGELDKFVALHNLLDRLAVVYNRPVGFSIGDYDHYNRALGIVVLVNPSIITALHEFAHHLGMGEHGACRWSVWLFKKVFPGSFAKLRFIPGSHMLVRQ